MSRASRPVMLAPRALLPALIFDSIALAGLIAVVVGGFERGDALGLVFLGALGGLAVLPAAVLSGIVLRRVGTHRGWRTRRYVLTVSGLGILATAIGPAALAVAWQATPNPAAAAAAPFAARIDAAGGRRLCSNGDPGRGPDNFTAWYETYYTVPASTQILRLLDDQAERSAFGRLRPTSSRASSFSDSQAFASQRRASGSQQGDLDVELSPTGTQLDCEPQYGQTVRTGRGEIIVDLTTTVGSTG